jgi:hypothetical protein
MKEYNNNSIHVKNKKYLLTPEYLLGIKNDKIKVSEITFYAFKYLKRSKKCSNVMTLEMTQTCHRTLFILKGKRKYR